MNSMSKTIEWCLSQRSEIIQNLRAILFLALQFFHISS